jgi:hypothetical protein
MKSSTDFRIDFHGFYAIMSSNFEQSIQFCFIFMLSCQDTSIISNYSLKTVLDWTWAKYRELHFELCEINKKLITTHVLFDKDLVDAQINKILNAVRNLIKIYELFIQLNQTSDGFIELNKKVKVLNAFSLFCEHLLLFLDFDLLPEKIGRGFSYKQTDPCFCCGLSLVFASFFAKDENCVTSISKFFDFAHLQNCWAQRRKSVLFGQTNKYEHTFMIDTLLNECKPYVNTSCLVKTGTYPPKASHELLELLVECNLTTEIKQMILLYFMIDLKHNVSAIHVTKVYFKKKSFEPLQPPPPSPNQSFWLIFLFKIGKLIEFYCKVHSTKTNIYDLVNGFYSLDTNDTTNSYFSIRTCDMDSLEIHEKYRILFNMASSNKWQEALEYLWLFNDVLNADGKSSNDSELVELHSKLLTDIYLANK